MSLNYAKLIRPHITPAESYAPGVSPANDPAVARLDWNESPFPLAPKAVDVLQQYTLGNRYPEYSQKDLRTALAKYMRVPVDCVLAGAGLDDVFNTLAMTILSPGDEVIIHEPTFGLYRHIFGLVHGATIVDVPLERPDWSLNTQGILDAVSERTKLIVICNPNNPSGNLLDPEAIERVVRGSGVLVAIDEAYAEFSGTDHRALYEHNDNVILFRTMSKFAGLAGFRVGYGVFPAGLMPWLRQTAPSFLNISALAADIAIASLQDLDVLHSQRDWVVAERDRIVASLNEIPGVTAYPSATNFVLFQLPVADAGDIHAQLAKLHVFVRNYSHPEFGLLDHLRASVGSEAENTMFLDALQSLLPR